VSRSQSQLARIFEIEALIPVNAMKKITRQRTTIQFISLLDNPRHFFLLF